MGNSKPGSSRNQSPKGIAQSIRLQQVFGLLVWDTVAVAVAAAVAEAVAVAVAVAVAAVGSGSGRSGSSSKVSLNRRAVAEDWTSSPQGPSARS